MSNAMSKETSPSIWHKAKLRVPLFEVDLGQAVYHGNYFHLFELGREAFLRDLGYPYKRFMEQQMHLTVVEATCSYRRPIHYDDLIEVQTAISGWRTRSLTFLQNVSRSDGENEVAALCTSVTFKMVCVRFSGQPTLLPEDFVRLLKNYKEGQLRPRDGNLHTRNGL